MKTYKKSFWRKLYLGVSYPLRHPVVSLIVLLAFFRHEIVAVWYDYQRDIPAEQHVAVIKKQTTDTLEAKLSEVRSSLKKIVNTVRKKDAEPQKKEEEKPRFANWNVGEFNKAKYVPVEDNVPVMEAEVPSFSVVKQQAEEQKNKREKEVVVLEEKNQEVEDFQLEDYYVKNTSLSLEYLSVPRHISGQVDIVGPNSLFVGDEFVFLYGIYSDPRVYDIRAAESYLSDLTKNKEVSCYIVATSLLNNRATALCFVGDQLINKMMTEHNFAQNVALQ